MNMLNPLLSGAIAMTSAVIALFFLRFWKSTNDRFFLFFSCSFFLEALNRTLLGLSALPTEDAPLYYIIRLAAYLFILYGIFDKNRSRCTDDKTRNSR